MKKSTNLFYIIIAISISSINTINTHCQSIIANHSIIEDYNIIPQKYIDSVKKMWVTLPGESHSSGYRIGLKLLENIDSRFQVSVVENGIPESATDQNLRFSRASWGTVTYTTGWYYSYGEEDWFTSSHAIQQTKDGIAYANTNNLEIDAIGFGWCWDMSYTPKGTIDPVFQTKWAGKSKNGPDGDKTWGLDKGDSILTGNRICMDTYLQATEEYIAFCETNDYKTKIYFTTGPVDNKYDNINESGFQRFIKTEYIRNYVDARGSGYLFDYADILSWNNADEYNTRIWTDRGGTEQNYEFIHPDNMVDIDDSYSTDGDHIGEIGAIRLAKAMWWMLARMSGWNGLPEGSTDSEAPSVPANLSASITSVNSADLSWNISTDNVEVIGYKIFRDDILIDSSITNSFIDNNLSIGNTYSFTVSAFDAANNESGKSSAIQVNTSDTEAPSIPTNLSASVTSVNSADLNWNISTDNVEVIGYKIFRDDILIDSSITNNYSDNNLSIGNTYSFTVSAYDAANNESGKSSTVQVNTSDTEAPSVPSNLRVLTTSVNSADLNWNTSTDEIGITGYKIYRNDALIDSSITNSFSDNNLSIGNTYSFTVSAYDAANNESGKSSAVLINTDDIEAPSIPQALKLIEANSDKISFCWNRSNDNVFVDRYYIFRNNIEINSTQDTSYIDESLLSNTTFKYQVKACDNFDNLSEFSASLEVKTLAVSLLDNNINPIKVYSDHRNKTINIYIPQDYNYASWEVEIFDIMGRLLKKTSAQPKNNAIHVKDSFLGGILFIRVSNNIESHYFRVLF